jgi:ABC-type branched-subunit amino acid transport system substrate-binding protein
MVSSVLPNETDFRGIATQVAAKRPDGVVFFLLPPQPSPFAKQYRVLDRTTPMFAFINTESENEVRAAQGALEGVVYVGPQFTETFVRDFSDTYGGNYPEICSGNFYDMVQMLARAVQQNQCQGEGLREFIASLNSFTGAGGTYGITPQREFRMPVELRTVRNGRFERYR